MFYNLSKDQLLHLGFSEEQIQKLFSKSTHSIVEKHLKVFPGDIIGAMEKLLLFLKKKQESNPYRKEKYIKQGLSEEEAEKKVLELKNKTKGSLERFITKYGEEEGRKKYQEFCKKSSNTKEKFQQKYGEDWLVYWEKYLKTKDSRSDDFFKKKYKDNWKEKRDEFIKKWAYQLSEEGMKERFGEEGSKIYKAINQKKSTSLENLIKKYGEEEGLKKYAEVNKKRSYANTIDYYIEKYGSDKGLDLFIQRRNKIGFTLENQIAKYGEEEGTRRYFEYLGKIKGRYTLEWFIDKYGEEEGKEKFKEHYKKINNKSVSKSSILFFEKLSEFLGVKLSYGTRLNEKVLTRENGRVFYYDCVDEENKIIFEFNGSNWHYHPSFESTWIGGNGITPEESIKKDTEKRNLAIRNGYRYYEIWDFEIRTKQKLNSKLKEIKEIFYEKNTT